MNNVNVLIKPVGKASIKEFGEPQAFLNDISFLFGDQSFFGAISPPRRWYHEIYVARQRDFLCRRLPVPQPVGTGAGVAHV